MDICFARFELNQSLHKVPTNKLWSVDDGSAVEEKEEAARVRERKSSKNDFDQIPSAFAWLLTANNAPTKNATKHIYWYEKWQGKTMCRAGCEKKQ